VILTALKHGTPTSQNFWCCDTSNTGGLMRVYIDGVSHDGPTLGSSTDYTGVLTVSGLSAGEHTYSIEVVGVGSSESETERLTCTRNGLPCDALRRTDSNHFNGIGMLSGTQTGNCKHTRVICATS